MKEFIAIVLLATAALGADNAAVAPKATTSLKPQAASYGTEAISIPQMLSYQGTLTDAEGQPVNGIYALTFRLYTAPTGGNAFWTEEQTIMVMKGLFSALLGAWVPITSVPDAGELYLSLQVETDPELSPRLRVASAAYAYKADTANYALASPGGGDNAWVRGTPDSVLYTVHRLGIARGEAGNMLYGTFRQSHVNLGVSCTTGVSGQNYSNVTVGGGLSNRARAGGSTVGGGSGNFAGGVASVVAGGTGNAASGDYSSAVGGYGDTALALCGGVLSGYLNQAGDAVTDTCAVVAGGYRNSALSRFTTIGGGDSNTVTSPAGTIAGGEENLVTDWHGTVGGGQNNIAGDRATVAGGAGNQATGWCSTVPGGLLNEASGPMSFAAGGVALSRHTGCFVWSDSGWGVSGADTVRTTGKNQWKARARNGVWFYSNSAMTTGAYLAPGSNSWESACDSMTKEDFRVVDRKVLLDKVAALRVRDYKMKDQNDGTRHIGPVAQDFNSAFRYGGNQTSINMADADGVLLAAVQALYEQNQNQQAEIEALKAKLAGQ